MLLYAGNVLFALYDDQVEIQEETSIDLEAVVDEEQQYLNELKEKEAEEQELEQVCYAGEVGQCGYWF